MVKYGRMYRLIWVGLFLASSLVLVFSPVSSHVLAAPPRLEATPPGPDRYAKTTVDVTLHEWWLISWEDNEIICQLFVEHDGTPIGDEVYNFCGSTTYEKWINKSQPCSALDITDCKGFYFQFIRDKKVQRSVPIKLPEPQVWVSLDDCKPDKRGWCTTQPHLILTAQEPLSNFSITRIEGFVGDSSFSCDGANCSFLLSATREKGVLLRFWAYSSYGDSSEPYEALLKVTSNLKDHPGSLVEKWYVQILSSQWTGAAPAACARAWSAFPPVENIPPWLITPASSKQLKSNIPYSYLAGNLISQNMVDVSACSDFGLLPNGAASQCGLEAARPAVQQWQNRFDSLIFTVSKDTTVPAQMLKNLFSRESQFWPGVYQSGSDVGLGQLTEDGADTTLLWNPVFYRQFCPLVLDKTTCETKVYSEAAEDDLHHDALSEKQRAMLRGALVQSVDATCATCPLGLDLARADFSVSVFARTLLANCEQAGQAVTEITSDVPGENVSYEDMWRFTLVNYNAGVGCLYDALDLTQSQGSDLTWANVSPFLEQVCPGSVKYVEDIAK